MPFKPFEIKMTEQQVIDGLKSTFGNEFTTHDVRAFCAMNDISYNTVTRKIKKFRNVVGNNDTNWASNVKTSEPTF